MRTIDRYQEKLRSPLTRLSSFLLRAATCRGVLLLLTATCLLVPAAHAQYRASIQGVVSDSTGAVIPDATLTLVNTSTGEKQVRTSNAAGIFNFNADRKSVV